MKVTDYRTGHNMCFDIEWQCHFARAESQKGNSVQRKKFSAKCPHLLKAKRCYGQVSPTNVRSIKENGY
jgi:hypothetical protein